MKKNLESLYAEWREAGEDAAKDTGLSFTWDCGEGCAREDFSFYADLEEEISFEEMLELERNYEQR